MRHHKQLIATQFKHGNSGGPGRPKLSEEARALKKITNDELTIAICQVIRMTRKQYVKFKKENKGNVSMIQEALADWASSGDPNKAGKVIDYVYTKPQIEKEKEEHPIIDVKKYEDIINKGYQKLKNEA